ncbi:MAG: prepilin-type N-terminal cleavage/methylation domain-containing protein [Candidatus Paceibacterota bacterium]
MVWSHPQLTLETQRGFSFIEVIVASALLLLIFSGLLAGIQLMMELIGHSKAEAGARSLAVAKMEYIRSFEYDEVGTISGIPSGPIPQNSTTTLNGVTYNERVLIQYVDREEDGFAGADSNGITEDSKRIKIEYTWNVRGKADSLIIVSDIVPRGIESTAGGGTLLINVFDASVQPVAGASVHVYNDSVATDTIDVIVTTNANGIANFPGAPARGGYQITVTKAGYSTDQTYSASSTNSSPNPPHVSVSAGVVSTVYFSIDVLSDLTLRAISTPVKGVFSDSFSSDAQLASTSNTRVSGGSLILTDSGGVYNATGTAFATTTTPSTLDSWESLDFNGTTSTSTAYRVRLYSTAVVGSSTVYTLLPDTELSGNTVGFIAGPVDITSIDASTYDSLALGVTLTTTDSSETPELYDWKLTHIETETPISGVTFDVAGDKSIGTHSGQPVLKYQTTATTDGSGEVTLSDMEWDAYTIALDGAVEGYDIYETYAPLPYALSPGVSDTLTLVLEPHAAYSLRTTVVDTDGVAVGGAQVHLYNGSYDQTQETSIYGQTYFTGMGSSTDYSLDVTAVGYDPDTQTNVSITGTTEIQVVLADEGTSGEVESGGASSTPSTFLAGYTSRIPLTIDGSSLFGNVNDFPVYVDLADLPGGFFASVQSNGADVRITKADGLTEVPFELVNIDTGGQTGELHFKADSLTISTTTTHYIYYGHATATAYSSSDTYGRNNVWSNSYRAVYHFEEGQSGTGNINEYVDATGNGYDGDDYVTATGKSGMMGSGQQFNDNYDDYLELPRQVLNGATNLTTSLWFRSNNDTIHSLISAARSGEGNEYLWWLRGDENEVEIFSHGNPREEYDIADIYDNSWRHLVAVLDDSANLARVYLNGSEDNQSPRSANVYTLNVASGGLIIGQDQDSVGGGFDDGQELDGYIDELRVSWVVRSAGWIANEYANQNSPTGFYSIGSIETE